MNPKHKAAARLLAILIAGAPLGCLPTKKADVRQDAKDSGVTPASYTVDASKPPADTKNGDASVIAAKRCGLSIAILSRPAKEHALNEALWHAADEQAIPVETLRTLEANGLRVGMITGALPIEIEAVLNPPPPGQKVQVVSIDQPDGEPTSIDLSAAAATTTLLINRDGRAFGKDYDDAKGLLRVTAVHDASGLVRLKVVPEIHHGPKKKGYVSAPAAGPFQPREFMMKEGQTEETFRELAATLTVRPGQVVAIGGRGDSTRGLGGFLFTHLEPNSDRVEQRVVLIWAQPGATVPQPSPSRGLFSRGDRKTAQP
jgi:hypothetical protein